MEAVGEADIKIETDLEGTSAVAVGQVASAEVDLCVDRVRAIVHREGIVSDRIKRYKPLFKNDL